jgi:glycosyltransferase involved in cell wall biosynthesis
MRVAVFTETFLPKVDGIVSVVCLLLDHLTARGIKTVVVAPKIGDVKQYNATPVIGVPAVALPPYPELKVGPPTLATYHQVKAFRPDIAHFIHPVLIGIPGMMMARGMGIPIVSSFHLDVMRIAGHFRLGLLTPLIRRATRVTFNWADYCLAPSRLIQREMEAIGIRNVGLWRRGVDTERFHPRFYSEAMRHELSNGHPEDTLLLYVGRLSTEKQIPHLRPVLERIPNTRLAVIGDGPAREAVQAAFVGTKARFIGYLQGERLSQAYASADIFVFPSSMETFGLVVPEAMAAGLPVVASRVGGVMDVIEEGVRGYTFEPGDIEALVEGVRRIAADRDRMKAMGRAARAFAETQTWPAIMDEVIAHYHRLIRAARGL